MKGSQIARFKNDRWAVGEKQPPFTDYGRKESQVRSAIRHWIVTTGCRVCQSEKSLVYSVVFVSPSVIHYIGAPKEESRILYKSRP